MIPAAPIFMIGAGILVLLIAARVLIRERRTVEVVPYSNVAVEMPAKWDDAEITRLLQRYQNQPAILSHAVSSIKARLIMNQDFKTAQRRLKLVSSVIELFRANKELQSILYDLQLAEQDFLIRRVENEMRLEDAQERLRSERGLRELRRQRDELQAKKEITQLKADIDGIEKPKAAASAPELTFEQKRAQEKKKCEARIAELKVEKQQALKIQDEDERLMRVNALDDAIQREYERWAKLV